MKDSSKRGRNQLGRRNYQPNGSPNTGSSSCADFTSNVPSVNAFSPKQSNNIWKFKKHFWSHDLKTKKTSETPEESKSLTTPNLLPDLGIFWF